MLNKFLCFLIFHDYSIEDTFAYKNYPSFKYKVCKNCGKIK